uniref:Pyrin domain-containing protein n=1 Tax=Anabas testudineus TaxID=64144 RepID=A0A3Q1JZJ5_ANATE
MSELDLMNITEHLTDEELKRFKWHLKNEKVDDIEPIKAAQLSKAEREEIVDLMCQKYEVMRASEVMKSILKKLNRNDLAAKLSKIMGTEDPLLEQRGWTQSSRSCNICKSLRRLFNVKCCFKNTNSTHLSLKMQFLGPTLKSRQTLGGIR